MRTFIAIELPQEVKEALQRLQARLKQAGADVKWVAPKNIHLTLKFLGEIDENKADSIGQLLEEIAKSYSVFPLRIASIGAFPRAESPRIIWVGIDQGDEQVKKIAASLEEKLAHLGIPKEERPFSSHITIGRTKSALNRQNLIQELKKLEGGAPRLYSRGPFVFGIPPWGGIPPECPFIPTFTGGAFWVRGNFAEGFKEFPVEKLILFKSTLTPQGPLYATLKEAALTTT